MAKPKTDTLYLLKANIPGAFLPKTVHKIGITDRHPSDRIREIIETGGPKCSIVGYTTKGKAAKVEAEFHRKFKPYQHRFKKRFSGHTEFFNLPPGALAEIKRFIGVGFELTRIDEWFMWAILAAVTFSIFR